MGIKGIYNEIGPGQRIALSKLAVETYEQKGRPLRIAIDISIWLFQIQAGKGGSNPALRTFYYRLLRLISLAIHPLFVFDGPNKPPFKRNKRTGPNVASIPEFLAKQLLKQFGLPIHLAPGEAEAECALLQKKGLVDAVLSEDVDTLMFGSGITLRNWSADGALTAKTPTHVNLYDARMTKTGKSGLDREGMILVALMSGGDYVPEGIPGCGPKTACEAARAGFGDELCKIGRRDQEGFTIWKEKLRHELTTNESRYFKQKHKALVIPEDFPRSDILGYYVRPVVSAADKIERLRETLKWDHEIDVVALRTFCAEAFDWTCISGAKKFIRNLAPALLVKSLRLDSDAGPPEDEHEVGLRESRLIKTIYKKREHVTTDNTPELRVGFIPMNMVDIDLDAEEPGPELPTEDLDSEEDIPVGTQSLNADGEPSSPRKPRGPSQYDPTQLEKIWVLETFVRVGIPMKVQDWEEAHRNAKHYEAMKILRKRAEKRPQKAARAALPQASMKQFTKATKPGQQMRKGVSKLANSERTLPDLEFDLHRPLSQPAPVCRLSQADNVFPFTQPSRTQPTEKSSRSRASKSKTDRPGIFDLPKPLPVMSGPVSGSKTGTSDVIDLLSSSPPREPVFKKRSLRRSISDTSALQPPPNAARPTTSPPPQQADSVTPPRSPRQLPQEQLLEKVIELPPSVSTRKKRSPLRRMHTLPNGVRSVSGVPVEQSGVTGSGTPPAKRQTLFRMPQTTSSPSHSPSVQQPLFMSSQATQPLQPATNPPFTPSRKTTKVFHGREIPKQAEVITLSSSPQTSTHSSQGLIKTWLVSPSEIPPTPSPIFARPPELLYTSAPDSIRKSTPPIAAWKHHNARRKMLRLRESLEGACALEDFENDQKQRSTGRVVRTTTWGTKDAEAGLAPRTWRYSEVEALDLSTR